MLSKKGHDAGRRERQQSHYTAGTAVAPTTAPVRDAVTAGAAAAAAAAGAFGLPIVMRHQDKASWSACTTTTAAAAALLQRRLVLLFFLLGFLTCSTSALPATPSPTDYHHTPTSCTLSPSRNRASVVGGDAVFANHQRSLPGAATPQPTAATSSSSTSTSTSTSTSSTLSFSPRDNYVEDTDFESSTIYNILVKDQENNNGGSGLIPTEVPTSAQPDPAGDPAAAAAAAAASPPPYTPIVTPPPDQDAELAEMGYHMTTFYTCDTIGGMEHCGWHVPVVKADGPTTKSDVRVVLALVSCLAGIFAWGLL